MPRPLSLTAISMAVARARGEHDSISGLGVRDGVAHQVAQNLCQPVGVGVERPAYGLQLEIPLAEQRQVTADVLEEVGELDRARLDQLAGLRAGQGEHLADQPVELVEPVQQRRGGLVPAPFVRLPVQ